MTEPDQHTMRVNVPDAFRWPPGVLAVACVDVAGAKVAVSIIEHSGARGYLTEPTAEVGHHGVLAELIQRLIDQACSRAGMLPRGAGFVDLEQVNASTYMAH